MARRHPVAAAGLVLLLALLAVWVGKLVGVKRSVDDAREYWSVPRGEEGGLLYVALGDSAAQGVGASRPDRSYVGLLADRLRAETGRPVQVVNLSSSGAHLDDVLREQLPRLRELSPDLVTVGIGGNDIRDLDRERFAAEIATLTAALPEGAVIADAPYFMHGRWERDALEAARLVQASAAEHGLTVARLHDAQQDEGWQAMFTQFSADWFHPNDRGYRVWAQAFWEAIDRAGTARRLS